jgi:hypothetical protein
VAPPGNQAANRENKLQPIAMEGPGLLDKSHGIGSWQVWIRESSVSEPLTRCRNVIDGVKTGVLSMFQDKSRGNLFTAWVASGIKVAGT